MKKEKALKNKKNFFKTFSIKQLVAFIIALLFIALGLIFVVLGLIDDYTNIYGSVLTTPNESMKAMMGGVGFTWFGVIITFLGSIVLAISLSLASKFEDREREKEARRRQRLESMSQKVNFESTIEDSTINNKE